jgi:hypothetical protein
MEKLKGAKNVFFSTRNHASGIMDGIRHYGFLKTVRKSGGGRDAGKSEAAS